MTHHELGHWLADLERCPANAVEHPLLHTLLSRGLAFLANCDLSEDSQI